MSEVAVRSLAAFLRSVAVLALDAPGQLGWLRSLGLGEPGIVDEIALEFHDGYLLMWAFVGEGWLPEESRPALAELDRALTAMSGPGNADAWDVTALASDARWEHVRQLARDALSRIT